MEVFWDNTKWTNELSTKWAGKSLEYQREMESTNKTAAQLGSCGAIHGTLVVADKQTVGRGRRGRVWESPEGKNLYFSLLLRPEITMDKISMLTLVMAHSAAKAIEKTADIRVGIKWPNDILVEGKKVCGILTEMNVEGGKAAYVIVGVGINVHPQEFPDSLRDKAIALESVCTKTVDRKMLLRRVMECFEADYERFAEQGDMLPFMEYYHSRLLNKDATVRVLDPQNPFEGIARGISSTGELLVEDQTGQVHQVFAGEVSVRGTLGYV